MFNLIYSHLEIWKIEKNNYIFAAEKTTQKLFPEWEPNRFFG